MLAAIGVQAEEPAAQFQCGVALVEQLSQLAQLIAMKRCPRHLFQNTGESNEAFIRGSGQKGREHLAGEYTHRACFRSCK